MSFIEIDKDQQEECKSQGNKEPTPLSEVFKDCAIPLTEEAILDCLKEFDKEGRSGVKYSRLLERLVSKGYSNENYITHLCNLLSTRKIIKDHYYATYSLPGREVKEVKPPLSYQVVLDYLITLRTRGCFNSSVNQIRDIFKTNYDATELLTTISRLEKDGKIINLHWESGTFFIPQSWVLEKGTEKELPSTRLKEPEKPLCLDTLQFVKDHVISGDSNSEQSLQMLIKAIRKERGECYE